MADILARLEDFDVSITLGFLPSSLLESLPSPYYSPWESAAAALPHLIKDGAIREVVESMPLLETILLCTEEEWRRAYVILGYLCNAYLFAIFPPAKKLPLCISQPVIEVAARLGLPPVPTYSGQTLWNHRVHGSDDTHIPIKSFQTQVSFTGSPEESSFFTISVAIEECGAPLIPTLLRGIQAAKTNDSPTLMSCLRRAEKILKDMTALLPSLYQNCSPDFFYLTLRPFLEGTRDLGSVGLVDGVFFEERNGGVYRKYRGPSNAQSSLFAFVDIALGVNHCSEKGLNGPEDAQFGDPKMLEAKAEFLREMRWYMPRGHREFLGAVEREPDISTAIRTHFYEERLRKVYNECLAALAKFRDVHIQLVTRYVVVMANRRRGEVADKAPKMGETAIPISIAGASGTGGTRPIEFLKSVRDDVVCASLL